MEMMETIERKTTATLTATALSAITGLMITGLAITGLAITGLAITGLAIAGPALAAPPPAAAQQEGAADNAQPSHVDMAEMMRRAQQYTQPSEHHKELERFLGEWDSEIRITMPGAGQAEKGRVSTRWLMEGRWLISETRGTVMGLPLHGTMLLGYDNFKQSYVTTQVSSIDTAMVHSEGDMTPDGKALITYGTLDEYLTGEHDKMVKYVWRFVSDDEILMEVHDLPIGERNTKVLELKMKRRAQPAADQGEER